MSRSRLSHQRRVIAVVRFLSLATLAAITTTLWMRGLADESQSEHEPESSGQPSASAVVAATSKPETHATQHEVRDFATLRRALKRRGFLAEKVAGLESALEMREATYWGKIPLPPTTRNCAITRSPDRPDCPMLADSPEMLRYLVDCNAINYDIPTHIYRAHQAGGSAPWAELELESAQQAQLERTDKELLGALEGAVMDAYRFALGKEPPAEKDLAEIMFEVRRSGPGKAERSNYGLGARARLGELTDEEIDGLTPIAHAFVRLSLAGDSYERSVADIIGPEQARVLRRRQRGWGDGFAAMAHAWPEGGECGVDLPTRDP